MGDAAVWVGRKVSPVYGGGDGHSETGALQVPEKKGTAPRSSPRRPFTSGLAKDPNRTETMVAFAPDRMSYVCSEGYPRGVTGRPNGNPPTPLGAAGSQQPAIVKPGSEREREAVLGDFRRIVGPLRGQNRDREPKT